MNDAAWAALYSALGVGIPVILVQFVLPIVKNRSDRIVAAARMEAERKAIVEDRESADARQDLLAARLIAATEAAAIKAEHKAEETALTLLASNRDIAKATAATDTQLTASIKEVSDTGKTTHALVNSSLTATKQSLLDTYVLSLAALRQGAALSLKLGDEPTDEALALIKATEAKIVELTKELAERHRAAGVVEAMQKNQAAENDRIAATDAKFKAERREI